MQEIFVSYKFSYWRRFVVKRFFPNLSHNFKNIDDLFHFSRKKKGEIIILLVWGTQLEEENIKLKDDFSLKILRLEDGFIRSMGLGIKLTPPLSIVADPLGIYYDATKPSWLERILSVYEFDENLKERARRLIDVLIKKKITKYNLEEKSWHPRTYDKKIIVVPGQVETDKSLKYGSPLIKRNIDLLRKVRLVNQDAYIVYKPHPDVVEGMRIGLYNDKIVYEYCDEVCINCSSIDLISKADEVHTLTSLFGFEALLRSKQVVCYGLPFYAGWGLTKDYIPCHRRRRKLSLEELVIGSLIIYPLYTSLIKKGKFLTPEEAIEELVLLKNSPTFKFKMWRIIQEIISPFLRLRRF